MRNMNEQIIITIDPEGEAKVEVKGHSGEGCLKLTQDLERALGEKKSDVKTREYSQRNRNRVRVDHLG